MKQEVGCVYLRGIESYANEVEHDLNDRLYSKRMCVHVKTTISFQTEQ